jgi:hypothetical protein
MPNFRKYGGINFSQNANIVRHNMLNSKNVSFNQSGLYNSRESFLSHIDMSGNSLLHVGNLYFQDGSAISTATNINPGISQVLGYGSDASGKSMTNIGNLGYSGGTTQSSSYTGYHPTTSTTYKYATITLNTNGQISNIIDNSSVVGGLGDVLDISEDGNGKSIKNVSDISANNTISTKNLNLTSTGKITFENGKQQNTSYTGWTPLVDTSYNFPTLRFDTNGKIINVVENNYGLEDILINNNNAGGLGITNIKNIVQSQTGTEENILKATTFQGNITQSNNTIISQSGGTGTNLLKATTFQGIAKYSSSNTFSDINDIPNKGYVDALASGLTPTALCNCATTGTINLPNVGNTFIVDNYTVLNGDRILVKSQGDNSGDNINTSNVNNGIYVYDSVTGNLTRSSDCLPGTDVSNQLTFITDGSLNKMKAFVQSNSQAIVGQHPLNYVPFYSLNYNLGQGLELVGGATLQVKSKLDFLTQIYLKGLLNLTDISLSNFKTQIYHETTFCAFVNDRDTTGDQFPISYQFLCNNNGPDEKQTTPLRFNSSSFIIDMSNNNPSFPPVKYQAINNSAYGVTIGHNFTGDCYFNNNIKFPTTRTLGPNNNSLGRIYNITTKNTNIPNYIAWTEINGSTINCQANKTYLISGKWIITTNSSENTNMAGVLCFSSNSPPFPLNDLPPFTWNGLVDDAYTFYQSIFSEFYPLMISFNYVVNFTTDTNIKSYVLLYSMLNGVSVNCGSLKYTILY